MDNNEKPLVTFALFAYNQEDYIREAIEGAFSQTYEPLEIILSDDCSADNTFKFIEEKVASYHGSHDIVINRNEVNLGLSAHVNKIFEMARGQVVVVAAGDDISYGHRVSDVIKTFSVNAGAICVSFIDDRVNSNGQFTKINPIRRKPGCDGIKVSLGDFLNGSKVSLSGASRAYKKDVFNFFGDINSQCPTEDTPLLLRSLMLGDAIVLPYAGIKYRRHNKNLSSSATLADMEFDAIFQQYERDLFFSKKNGVVSNHEFDSVSRWVKGNIKNRVLHRNFHKSEGVKKLYFLLCLVLHSSYPYKTKLLFIFRYLNIFSK